MSKRSDVTNAGLIGLAGLSALRGASELSKIKSGESEPPKKELSADKYEEYKRSIKEASAPSGAGKESSSKPQYNKKGGVIRTSASSRADGCAVKGKTKGRMI